MLTDTKSTTATQSPADGNSLRPVAIGATLAALAGCVSDTATTPTQSDSPLTVIRGTAQSETASDDSAVGVQSQPVTQSSDIDWSSYLGYWFSAPDNNTESGPDSDAPSPNADANGANTAPSSGAAPLYVGGVPVPQPVSVDGTAVHAGQQLTIVVGDSTASMHYRTEVTGPVDNITGEQSLVVMGQPVLLSASTHAGRVLEQSIEVGDIVEVSGIRDAEQQIRATYIEEKDRTSTRYSVRGVVSNFNPDNRTFTIGQLTVDYGQLQTHDYPLADLGDHQWLRVTSDNSAYEPGSHHLVATDIDHYDSGLAAHEIAAGAESNTWIRFQAYITEIVSDDLFRLGGTSVRVSTNTRFENGSRENLTINTFVEVEGPLSEDAQILASKIEFAAPDHADVATPDGGEATPPAAPPVADNAAQSDPPPDDPTAPGPTAGEAPAQQPSAPGSDADSDASSASATQIDPQSYLGYWYSAPTSDSAPLQSDAGHSGSNPTADREHDDADDAGEREIQGIVQWVDAASGHFRVADILVRPGPATIFEDDADNRLSKTQFLSQLNPGRSEVEVEWNDFASFDNPPDEIELRD